MTAPVDLDTLERNMGHTLAVKISIVYALIAELRAARQDAARLDWLDANAMGARSIHDGHRNVVCWGVGGLRAAIDHRIARAAIAKGTQT